MSTSIGSVGNRSPVIKESLNTTISSSSGCDVLSPCGGVLPSPAAIKRRRSMLRIKASVIPLGPREVVGGGFAHSAFGTTTFGEVNAKVLLSESKGQVEQETLGRRSEGVTMVEGREESDGRGTL